LTPANTDRVSARTWFIWLAAAMVYFLAMFHRTSFGVAGLEAAERFGVGAAALGTFTVLQIGVYALMQVPTGVLVDRFGPRATLIAALVFLGAGQMLIAVADEYWQGLLARGILGVGDALTFISVLRIAASHFPARRYTLVAALTGALGFVGNLAATMPLTLALAGPGWMPTFLAAGLATVSYILVVHFAVRQAPHDKDAKSQRVPARHLGRQVTEAWRVPGTRLAFWVHFTTAFGPGTLSLMWGMPYLVSGQGYTETEASGLLMVLVFGSMIGGPAVGAYIGRRPEMRMPLVITYLSGSLIWWTLMLAWPGQVPLVLLVPALVWLALGGPASMIGFALARDYNPLSRVGTATGVVNVGGFTATAIAMLVVGALLELTGDQFRIALLAVVVLLLFGSWRMTVWYRRSRAVVLQAQERGEAVPVQLRRRPWDVPDREMSTAGRRLVRS
jgi:MFS family permease